MDEYPYTLGQSLNQLHIRSRTLLAQLSPHQLSMPISTFLLSSEAALKQLLPGITVNDLSMLKKDIARQVAAPAIDFSGVLDEMSKDLSPVPQETPSLFDWLRSHYENKGKSATMQGKTFNISYNKHEPARLLCMHLAAQYAIKHTSKVYWIHAGPLGSQFDVSVLHHVLQKTCSEAAVVDQALARIQILSASTLDDLQACIDHLRSLTDGKVDLKDAIGLVVIDSLTQVFDPVFLQAQRQHAEGTVNECVIQGKCRLIVSTFETST